jgi:hypothetical protein
VGDESLSQRQIIGQRIGDTTMLSVHLLKEGALIERSLN